MTQESRDPEPSYDDHSDYSDGQATFSPMMSAGTFQFGTAKRRRTFSENAASEDRVDEGYPRHEAHLRRRTKSGDDGRRDRFNSPFGKNRSRSGNMVWGNHHHHAEDRKPLLQHIDKIERVCLDTLAQVARCTTCHCTHSDDSSCDTSCSSHCQSCEKICQANGRSGFISLQPNQDDAKIDDLKSDLFNTSTTYGHVNEMADVVCNGELERYHDNPLLHHHHVPDHLPTVTMCNGHGPSELEQVRMLLEEEPSKAAEVAKAKQSHSSKFRAYFGLIILLFANTLNYMDRYTIAGKTRTPAGKLGTFIIINLCHVGRCCTYNKFHSVLWLIERGYYLAPRRGLRGIVFCLCVRPIFLYFISRLLEEISI